MFVVRGGKVIREYKHAAGKGKISEPVMLSNGILYRAGTEVHTAQRDRFRSRCLLPERQPRAVPRHESSQQ